MRASQQYKIDGIIASLLCGQKVLIVSASAVEAQRMLNEISKRVSTDDMKRLTMEVV